jgi:uncharacterized membrane protein
MTAPPGPRARNRPAGANELATQPAVAWLFARSAATLLVGLASPALPARADLQVCNGTQSRIGVAIGYQDHKGWATEGWWNIASQTCTLLLKGNVPSRYIYIHAIDYDRSGEWSGTNYMCTADRTFAIRDVRDCQRRGFRRTGFFEVDTGEAKDWTIRLTDPEDAGARPK